MRSGPDALDWAEDQKTWPHAMCMNFVWNAFGAPSVKPPGGYPDANSGWDRATKRHPGDKNPPPGAPVYFTGSDGHVCLATGNGQQVYSTDVAGYGINGYSTIDQICKMWGRSYKGWCGDIFGYTIDFAGTSGGDVTPFPEGIDMSNLMAWITKNEAGKDQCYIGYPGIALGVSQTPFDDISQFIKDGCTGRLDPGSYQKLAELNSNYAALFAPKASSGGGEPGEPIDYSRIATPDDVAAVGEKVDAVPSKIVIPDSVTVNYTAPGTFTP